jgi:hypothetical protein
MANPEARWRRLTIGGTSLDRPQPPREHPSMTDKEYLDPRTRAELERRGVENVRLLIANPMWVGVGEGSDVLIGGGNIPKPNRGQVERWLSEQNAMRATEEKRRHDQVLFWAIAATIAGIVGVLLGLAQWLWPR